MGSGASDFFSWSEFAFLSFLFHLQLIAQWNWERDWIIKKLDYITLRKTFKPRQTVLWSSEKKKKTFFTIHGFRWKWMAKLGQMAVPIFHFKPMSHSISIINQSTWTFLGYLKFDLISWKSFTLGRNGARLICARTFLVVCPNTEDGHTNAV